MTLVNTAPHVWDVSTDNAPARPVGTRHEIQQDGEDVLVREVWYFSDNGEVREVTERRMPLNQLVHLVVNMTENERRFSSEARTTWPEMDWDGVPNGR